MCFGIRILSPFQLNTLNIPIQNIRCPKTPKTHARTSFSPQPLFVKLELCRLCTSMPNPICVTGNAVHESHCSVQCFVQGYVIKDESDCRVLLFFFKASKKRPRSLGRGTNDSNVMSAHAFLVFLGT